MAENYLIHHGVKGMKWGVITKKDEPVGNGPRKTKTDPIETKTKKSKKLYDYESVAYELDELERNGNFDWKDYNDNKEPKIINDLFERAKKLNKEQGNKYSDDELYESTIDNVQYDGDSYYLYDRFSNKLKNEHAKEILSRSEINRNVKESNVISRKREVVGMTVVGTLLAGALGATAIGLAIGSKKKNKN